MSYEVIIYEKKDGIATLTFNRPEVRNAGNMQLYTEMGKAVEEFDKDDEASVLIVTGAGRAFHSGDDVKQLFLAEDRKEQAAQRLVQQIKATGSGRILQINTYKPTIAAVNGPAVGEGLAISLSCDIRIASEGAKFGYFYVRMGIVGAPLSPLVLPQIVGLSRAYEMMFSGELVDAAEALRIGLVSKVVPQEQLMTEAVAMAKKLMGGAPLAQRAIKQCVLEALLNPTNYQEFNHAKNRLLFQTEDHLEGAKAFAEKRQANYKGR